MYKISKKIEKEPITQNPYQENAQK